MSIEKTVFPIHFENRSGQEFERLAFAYLTRLKDWEVINWLGQTGSDKGRDIWGTIGGENYCYQCANYRNLPLNKVTADIDKLVKAKTIPTHFIVICGGLVSNSIREKIIEYAHSKKIQKVDVWNAVEFEEKLRKDAPAIIKRFVEGETFSDSPDELILFAKSHNIKNDEDIIDLLIECFDRPAFTTRFNLESSIPNFEQAVNDTIAVLNTGIYRLRDRTVIRNIPSRHRIADIDLKNKLADITKLVVKLRDSFVVLKNSKDIRPCECDDLSCSVYMLSPKACETMDRLRSNIFSKFREIKPDFNLQVQ
jgi:hypothetical protein